MVFSDFEGTIVLPEVSYKDWVSSRAENKANFESEWDVRLQQVKRERSIQTWEHYLDLYSGLFTVQDFKDISLKFSLNKIFESWCTKFLKAHSFDTANIVIITRGFAPIARDFFARVEVKMRLAALKVSVSSIIGSEPNMDKSGLMRGLKSVVYVKRKFVRDGHIMLGDDGEEAEFMKYPYFVNLAKWGSSDSLL